jgi:hypothetical protein
VVLTILPDWLIEPNSRAWELSFIVYKLWWHESFYSKKNLLSVTVKSHTVYQ